MMRLSNKLPKLREMFTGQQLYIHASFDRLRCFYSLLGCKRIIKTTFM